MNEISQFKAVACVLGSILLICIAFLFAVLVRRGARNKEEEAKDIPGHDTDFTYSERPFNSYDLFH